MVSRGVVAEVRAADVAWRGKWSSNVFGEGQKVADAKEIFFIFVHIERAAKD